METNSETQANSESDVSFRCTAQGLEVMFTLNSAVFLKACLPLSTLKPCFHTAIVGRSFNIRCSGAGLISCMHVCSTQSLYTSWCVSRHRWAINHITQPIYDVLTGKLPRTLCLEATMSPKGLLFGSHSTPCTTQVTTSSTPRWRGCTSIDFSSSAILRWQRFAALFQNGSFVLGWGAHWCLCLIFVDTGLGRTVYTHRIWPYIWWFRCQKHRI